MCLGKLLPIPNVAESNIIIVETYFLQDTPCVAVEW